jgi:hypothetical protein
MPRQQPIGAVGEGGWNEQQKEQRDAGRHQIDHELCAGEQVALVDDSEIGARGKHAEMETDGQIAEHVEDEAADQRPRPPMQADRLQSADGIVPGTGRAHRPTSMNGAQ